MYYKLEMTILRGFLVVFHISLQNKSNESLTSIETDGKQK